jgi:hypothetical protein
MRKVGLASIIFDLAYNFVETEKTIFSIGSHLVIPTGNEPEGKFVLEPIIGANQSWQLGFIINGIHDIYSPDLRKNVTLFLDATFSHLFKSNQKRVFALKNKPGSQFLLLKKFDPLGNVASLERVANVLLGDLKIGANIMIDASIMAQFKWCNFFMNVGYNFWYRSKENRDEKVLLNNFTENTFAIKGNTLASRQTIISECPLVRECLPIKESASNSTIAQSSAHDEFSPVFLKISDIDFNAPLNPHAYSNKIFGSIGYSKDLSRSTFLISLGAECEFGKNAIDQWGVFLNTGFTY